MVDDVLDTRFEGKEVKLTKNTVEAGEDINLMAIDPALHKLHLGMGWDLNAFDADVLDLDISLFLLDKNGKTRVDEDFVFYNNLETLNGAIKHMGDNRTGAGDGDDESITIDLHGVPFDVFKIAFVLSIYRGEEKQQSVRQIQKAFFRLVNMGSKMELLRYELTKVLEDRTETAVVLGSLNREGPKWHFTPLADFVEGGLAAVATRYGCIIVQS